MIPLMMSPPITTLHYTEHSSLSTTQSSQDQMRNSNFSTGHSQFKIAWRSKNELLGWKHTIPSKFSKYQHQRHLVAQPSKESQISTWLPEDPSSPSSRSNIFCLFTGTTLIFFIIVGTLYPKLFRRRYDANKKTCPTRKPLLHRLLLHRKSSQKKKTDSLNIDDEDIYKAESDTLLKSENLDFLNDKHITSSFDYEEEGLKIRKTENEGLIFKDIPNTNSLCDPRWIMRKKLFEPKQRNVLSNNSKRIQVELTLEGSQKDSPDAAKTIPSKNNTTDTSKISSEINDASVDSTMSSPFGKQDGYAADISSDEEDVKRGFYLNAISSPVCSALSDSEIGEGTPSSTQNISHETATIDDNWIQSRYGQSNSDDEELGTISNQIPQIQNLLLTSKDILELHLESEGQYVIVKSAHLDSCFMDNDIIIALGGMTTKNISLNILWGRLWQEVARAPSTLTVIRNPGSMDIFQLLESHTDSKSIITTASLCLLHPPLDACFGSVSPDTQIYSKKRKLLTPRKLFSTSPIKSSLQEIMGRQVLLRSDAAKLGMKLESYSTLCPINQRKCAYCRVVQIPDIFSQGLCIGDFIIAVESVSLENRVPGEIYALLRMFGRKLNNEEVEPRLVNVTVWSQNQGLVHTIENVQPELAFYVENRIMNNEVGEI